MFTQIVEEMSKPPSTLLQMPWHIKQKIVAFSTPLTRLSVRRCCKTMRQTVDSTKKMYDNVSFKVWDGTVIFTIGKETVRIRKHMDKCIIDFGRKEKLVEGVGHMEMAANVLFTILGAPGVSVNWVYFRISFSEKYQELRGDRDILELKTKLHQATILKNRKLRVQNLKSEYGISQDQLMCILPSLQPGYLYYLDLELSEGLSRMDRVTETEQWKQARKLNLKAPDFVGSKLTNFTYALLSYPVFSVDDVRCLVEGARENGEKFSAMWATCAKYFNMPAISAYLSQFTKVDQPYPFERYKIPIPNSEKHLELSIGPGLYSLGSEWTEDSID